MGIYEWMIGDSLEKKGCNGWQSGVFAIVIQFQRASSSLSVGQPVLELSSAVGPFIRLLFVRGGSLLSAFIIRLSILLATILPLSWSHVVRITSFSLRSSSTCLLSKAFSSVKWPIMSLISPCCWFFFWRYLADAALFLCRRSCSERWGDEHIDDEEALSGEEALSRGGGDLSNSEWVGRNAECLVRGMERLRKGGDVMEEIAIGLWEVIYDWSPSIDWDIGSIEM